MPTAFRDRPVSMRAAAPPEGRAGAWRRPRAVRLRFATLAAACDLLVLAASTVMACYAADLILRRAPGAALPSLVTGLTLGLMFAAANILSDNYDVVRFMTRAGHPRRVLWLWNATIVSALLLVFASKTTSDFSRGTAVLVYGIGYVSLLLARFVLVDWVRHNKALGEDVAQRIFLVGDEAEIERFTARHHAAPAGLRIVAAVCLRGQDTLADDLALAAASARMLRPNDIFILLPWSQSAAIDSCVAAFMRVPAAIHLGPERVLDRFIDARISRTGSIASLNLVRHPLTRTEIAIKRAVDVVVSVVLLASLLPFFGLVALAIRLETRGPVLFLQRRYGFNQEMFRIVKFRSMTAMDDGRLVPQATKGDIRVTRVGRILRRFNIDELPQLINVLRGEMSLVGPRPHALAHDQQFDRTIAAYARRHNVKPGITGWAQVNGLRGPVASDMVMRRRVEHDLYYIDHWSLALDLRILALTVFSSKAFENAF